MARHSLEFVLALGTSSWFALPRTVVGAGSRANGLLNMSPPAKSNGETTEFLVYKQDYYHPHLISPSTHLLDKSFLFSKYNHAL